METPKQRYKKGEITFNQMLKEILARTFSTFTPPKKWALLKAQKEGVDLDNCPYLDGDEDEYGLIEQQERLKEHYKTN
ncbi:hypothetical protein LCGC14_1473690 [marine sediment metagenome]|uniref:Uncharacterized protein n=1 Tax=marine sediment metagenome TaxID=412755 RepID=A0A0F9MDC5_9ZZZZ|nr:hypothetical protein [bacterium]